MARSKKNNRGDRQRIEALEREIEERDQVIGEITIANRILKKRVGGLL